LFGPSAFSRDKGSIVPSVKQSETRQTAICLVS